MLIFRYRYALKKKLLLYLSNAQNGFTDIISLSHHYSPRWDSGSLVTSIPTARNLGHRKCRQLSDFYSDLSTALPRIEKRIFLWLFCLLNFLNTFFNKSQNMANLTPCH